eukprot:COSAG03_NODE_11805_length_575_cov_1.025210_1_plen_62_part_10
MAVLRRLPVDGPADFRDRYGYTTSPELLARVTERQRACLEPSTSLKPLRPPVEEQQWASNGG